MIRVSYLRMCLLLASGVRRGCGCALPRAKSFFNFQKFKTVTIKNEIWKFGVMSFMSVVK